MTQMVTRCPKCATAFRITSTQLESAKGAVRCGSCLHIFKAQDYLVASASPAATPSNLTATSSNPNSAPSNPSFAPSNPSPTPSNLSSAPSHSTPSPSARTAKSTIPASETLRSAAGKTATAAPANTPKPSVANVQNATPKPKTPATKASAPNKAPAASKPLIDKTKVLADEDDVLISDDMDAATEKASTYEFDGFFDIDMQPKQSVSLFEREIRFDEPDDNDAPDTDESWAEHLLDDDDEESPASLKKLVPASAAAKTSAASTISAESKTAAAPTQNIPVSQAVSDDAHNAGATESSNHYAGPVFSLVGETPSDNSTDSSRKDTKGNSSHTTTEQQEEPVFSEAFLSATRAPDAAPTEASAFAAALFESAPKTASETDDEATTETDGSEKTAAKRPVKSQKMRAFDSSRAALLMNIMPAPLEFTAKRMRRWYQQKLWTGLAILMSITLLAQVAYFKFDYFSRVEPYRTLYLFSCPLLGCEVPSLIDTAQIEATNLIVRNHPSAANALLVDAILINKADFEQPFPDLILSFSTLDDVPVASRRFTPKEYLGGELAGMKYIPMHQPVHINLEISDPGPDAPNYSLITH